MSPRDRDVILSALSRQAEANSQQLERLRRSRSGRTNATENAIVRREAAAFDIEHARSAFVTLYNLAELAR